MDLENYSKKPDGKCKVASKEVCFPCPESPRTYKLKESLTRHMIKYQPDNPHVCPMCQMPCSHDSDLVAHLRTHIGEKIATCSVCGQEFSRVGSLNIHMRVYHTGERPFPCSNCSEKFASSKQLKAHLRTHPQKCHICSKTCRNGSELNDHLKLLHSGQGVLKCDHCPMRFLQKEALTSHAINTHFQVLKYTKFLQMR